MCVDALPLRLRFRSVGGACGKAAGPQACAVTQNSGANGSRMELAAAPAAPETLQPPQPDYEASKPKKEDYTDNKEY